MSVDELIDVVDEHDRIVTQATRREVRLRNLWHRSVYIFLFNTAGQLFVHQRSASKDVFPGYWDVAVGGVLTAGEDYEAGARRELSEETGVTNASLRRLFPFRYEDKQNRVCGVVYSCTTDAPLHLQPSEIVAGEWMDLDVLFERTQKLEFCPDSIEALNRYLSKLEAVRTGKG